MIRTLMEKHELLSMLKKQLNSFYFLNDKENECLNLFYDNVIDRMDKCLNGFKNAKYNNTNDTNGNQTCIFNPLNTCHYTIFLYFYANTLYRSRTCIESTQICDKLYGLCKTLSGADLFYEVNLPDIFFVDHPVGSVMARAQYGNYFSFIHGCTVGNNHGIYPVIGEHVKMYSDSKIVGNCHIGNNVILSANSYVKDTDIPDNTIVFGQSPNLILKENKNLL